MYVKGNNSLEQHGRLQPRAGYGFNVGQRCCMSAIIFICVLFMTHNAALLWLFEAPDQIWVLGATMGALIAQMAALVIVCLLIPRSLSSKVLLTLVALPLPTISFTFYAVRTGAGSSISTAIAIWMILVWTLLATPLLLLQWRSGLLLRWPSKESRVNAARPAQFGIREVMIGTAIIGVLLGVSRALFASGSKMHNVGGNSEFIKLLVVMTFFNTLAAYAGIFVAFRPKYVTLWLLGACLGCVLILGAQLLVCSWVHAFLGVNPLFLLLPMHGVQLSVVVLWIILLRGAGFQLIRDKLG